MHTHELRKHGVRIRLQDKSFLFLSALIEQPGEIVSREELQRRLWPGDMLIDFESGLNTTAKRLRIALGDSAVSPRYVETVARSGYRFITPIQQEEAQEAPVSTVEASRRATNRARVARWLLAIAAMGGTGAVAFALLHKPAVAEPRFRQLTFGRGQVSSARFTPDGSSI